MHIKIAFSCDNAAFEDDLVAEISSVVESVKVKILCLTQFNGKERVLEEGTLRLRDTNGNTIGKVIVEEEQ